jgi:integrase
MPRRSASDISSVYHEEVRPGVYKVRWRQWEMVDGQRVRRMPSLTVIGLTSRDELIVKIRHSMDTIGFYQHEAKPEEKIANLEEAAADWLRWKAGRGASKATIVKYGDTLRVFFRDVRRIEKIPEDKAVPGSVLTCDLLSRLRTEAWSHITGKVRYERSVQVYDLWKYLSDDPTRYPGVELAPRTASRALPPAPVRGEAPEEPTWAEVSAIVRRAFDRDEMVSNGMTPDLGLRVACMALSGLRIGQVHGIQVADIDLAEGTMRVRVGKSRREKADFRKIPLAPELLTLLRPRLLERAGDPAGLLFPSPKSGELRANRPERIMHELWEEATAASEVRREVWAPPNRKYARPDHAFRAAFLFAIKGDDSVKCYLVGHAPPGTRGRHYAKPSMEELRTAVNGLPSIDWNPPGLGVGEDNVVQIRAKKAR